MLQVNKLKNKFFIGALTTVVVAVFALNYWLDFSFQGQVEGIYLLKGPAGKLLLTDDVFLGEEESLLAGINFTWVQDLRHLDFNHDRPHLEVEWSQSEGLGYIRNYLGGDELLMTTFSRYRGSDNLHTHGLFIGGALPGALLDRDENNSGMSYFDGQKWSHIWCNTNEGIGSSVTPHRYPPSAWRYLGSRIISQTDQHVVLTSDHELEVDGVLLRIERTVEITAGEPDLDLTVKISNVGKGVAHYFYYYGDEPWIGDFGSASGDIGWVEGRLVEFEERIDPKTVDYAGMADFGSSVLGEGHNFGHKSNFIAWLGPDKPDVVFFANQYEGFTHSDKMRIPLRGDARSIGMYWSNRSLVPGQSQIFSLAIGMAAQDPATGMPMLPPTVSAAHTKVALKKHPRKAG